MTILFTYHFSGPGTAVGRVCMSVSVCVRTLTFEQIEMATDLTVWLSGLSRSCLGQVQMSRSYVKVHGHRMKNVHFFRLGHSRLIEQ